MMKSLIAALLASASLVGAASAQVYPNYKVSDVTVPAGTLPNGATSVVGAITSAASAAAAAATTATAAQAAAAAAQATATAAQTAATAAGTTATAAQTAASAAQTTATAAVPSSKIGVPNGVAATDVNGRVPASQAYADSNYRFIGPNYFIAAYEGQTEPSGFPGETTRVVYTAQHDITHLKLFLPAQSANNGVETNLPNPVFYYAAVEYPLSGTSTPPNFTLGGQTQMMVGVQGAGVFTDDLGLYIPAGAQFAIRYGTWVAEPPAITASAVGSGGSLASGQTRYYEVTDVVNGVESAPSAAVAVTTTAANQEVTLTLGSPANAYFMGYSSYKVYEGTTSTNEGYLASVTIPQTTFIDTGAIPATFVAPPHANAETYQLNDYLESGMSSNSLYVGGSGGNLVSGSGAIAAASGPNSGLVSRPYLLADEIGGFSAIGFGDSEEAGFNVAVDSANLGYGPTNSSWFDQALIQDNIDFLNESIPSSTLSSLVSQGLYGSSTRWNLSRYGEYVFNNQGTNDIYSGVATGVQVASYQLQIAQAFYARGQRYYVTTLLPRVATTDHMLTLGGQSIANSTYEGYRQFYNNWVRAGFQVSNGVPVLTGGTPSPCIAGYFDIAQAIGEVNSAGVPTMNGGYWPVPASPAFTAQALTGTPTTTSLPVGAAAYTPHALAGEVVKITSGAASGQTAIISANGATTLTVSGLTTAPAAGDTLQIWATIGSDGTHATLAGQQNIDAGENGNTGFTAWVATHFTGF